MAGRKLPTTAPHNIAQTTIHLVVVQTAATLRMALGTRATEQLRMAPTRNFWRWFKARTRGIPRTPRGDCRRSKGVLRRRESCLLVLVAPEWHCLARDPRLRRRDRNHPLVRFEKRRCRDRRFEIRARSVACSERAKARGRCAMEVEDGRFTSRVARDIGGVCPGEPIDALG